MTGRRLRSSSQPSTDRSAPDDHPIRVALVSVALVVGVLAATNQPAAATKLSASNAATSTATATSAPVPHTTSIPVSCVSQEPTDPGNFTSWASNLTVTATYPDHVAFGGSFPVALTASFTYGGPLNASSLHAELRLDQLDRDGTGPSTWLFDDDPTGPARTMVPVTPLVVDVRGDVGGHQRLVAGSLTVTASYVTQLGVFSFGAACTPLPSAPAALDVVIDPPAGGVAPGDAVSVIVTRADGTNLFVASSMLATGDLTYTFEPGPGQFASVTGGGAFPGPGGASTYLAMTSSVGPPIAGHPNLSQPTMQLLLVDPASGLIVWVPSTTPTNGIAMRTDFTGPRTVGVVAMARGLAFPTGEPIIVTWGIRDLLTR